MTSRDLLELIQELGYEYCEEIDHTRSDVRIYSIISGNQKMIIEHFFNNPKKCYQCYFSQTVDWFWRDVKIDICDYHLLQITDKNEYYCILNIFTDTRQLKKMSLQQVSIFIRRWMKK